MSSRIIVLLLLFSCLVAQLAAAQSRHQQITDANEYDSYTRATQAKDDRAKAKALEEFLNQFPQSGAKPEALELLTATYGKLSEGMAVPGHPAARDSETETKAMEAAERLLKEDSENLTAIALLANIKRNQAVTSCKNPDQMKKLLAEAVEYARRGLDLKPAHAGRSAPESGEDARRSRAGKRAMLEGVLGYAELQSGDYTGAQTHLENAVDHGAIGLETLYPLAVAYLQAPEPKYQEGYSYLNQAAALAPEAKLEAAVLHGDHLSPIAPQGCSVGKSSAGGRLLSASEQQEESETRTRPTSASSSKVSSSVHKDERNHAVVKPAPPETATDTSLPNPLRQTNSSSSPATGRRDSGGVALDEVSSQSALRHINSLRAPGKNFNGQPLPSGHLTAYSNGLIGISASGGRNFQVRGDGTLAAYRDEHFQASFHSNGRLRTLHRASLDIRTTRNGARTITRHGPGTTLIVNRGAGGGYVQREVTAAGSAMWQRTYLTGGKVHTRLFRNYAYRGVTLSLYAPKVAYAPAFYGWAYYPWKQAARYTWCRGLLLVGSCTLPGPPPLANTVGNAPRGPAVVFVYPSASFWIADYSLGQIAQAASNVPPDGALPSVNADNVASAGGSEPPVQELSSTTDQPITPELRQSLADEVQQQIAQENAAIQNPAQAEEIDGLERDMQPGHVFIADQVLELVTPDARFCELSPGAVLTLDNLRDQQDESAELTVDSARKGECPAGTRVIVAVVDLQEMQNNFAANVDDGLHELYEQQGKGEIPAAPPSAIEPPPRPLEDEPPALTAPQLTTMLLTAAADADKAEKSLREAAFAPSVDGDNLPGISSPRAGASSQGK